MTDGGNDGVAPPLEQSFARVAAVDEYGRGEVAAPVGDGWLHLGGDAEQVVEAVVDLARAATPDERADYLAALVAGALADALIGVSVPVLVLDRRLPDVTATNLRVRRADGELWLERIAVDSPARRALAEDPRASDPTVRTVRSYSELTTALTATLVDALTPWFSALRARAPFGRMGMWGQVADDIHGKALSIARLARTDQRQAWTDATAVVDAVAALVRELRVRPRLFPVRWDGGNALWQVRGTCCLWYTTSADPDPCSDGYCTTCPLRPDDSRHERLAEWLQAT